MSIGPRLEPAHGATVSVMTAGKRAQGRPARGDTEVGSFRIVEGMRNTLRAMKTANVTRKDIAACAGVTPALVTYYFPERNGLIEAATLPVVQSLVSDVAASFKTEAPRRQQLAGAIVVLLEAFSRDGVIIQLFSQHRSSQAETDVPDLLQELDACLVSFFERWLDEDNTVAYDAHFLQKALIGICKCIGGDEAPMLAPGSAHVCEQKRRAWMICSMLVGPMPVAPTRQPVLCETHT